MDLTNALENFSQYGLSGLVIFALFFILWKVIHPFLKFQLEVFSKVSDSQDKLASSLVSLSDKFEKLYERMDTNHLTVMNRIELNEGKIKTLYESNNKILKHIEIQNEAQPKLIKSLDLILNRLNYDGLPEKVA